MENEKLNDKDLEEDLSDFQYMDYGEGGSSQCCYCGEILPNFCESHTCGNEKDLQVDFYTFGDFKVMRLLNISTRSEKRYIKASGSDDIVWKVFPSQKDEF